MEKDATFDTMHPTELIGCILGASRNYQIPFLRDRVLFFLGKQLRSMGFRNEVFRPLADVVERLCETIRRVANDMVKSIIGRERIIQCFS